MKNRIRLMIFFFACSFVVSAQSEEKPYSLSVDIGESKNSIGIYRVGLQREFSSWLKERGIPLSGYFEASLNYWSGSSQDIYGIAFSPVFSYQFCSDCVFKPYVEAGIGVALVSGTMIDGRDIASNFQFEDRIGLGVKKSDYDFHIRYMHYSNAGLVAPNEGLDIFLAGMAYKF